MPKFFKKAVPLNAAGLQFNLPREQRLWKVLTNVTLTNGFIQSRPGLKPVGPVSQDITSRMPGIITAIGEARQYVNEDSSIGSCQSLRPNATTSITGWAASGAATIHEATDETVPDNGTTHAVATADAATYIAGFTNLSPSYDFIDSVTLHIRARATAPLRQILSIEHGTGSLGVLGQVDLSNTAYTGDTAGSGFMDFFVSVPTDPQGFPWLSGDVNDATFKITLDKEANPGLTFLLPSATGSDDGFSAAGDAWKRSALGDAEDTTDAPIAWFADRQTTSVGEPGERISIRFANLTTLTSVTKVRVRFAVARQEGGLGRITLYQVGNDSTQRNIATSQSVDLLVPDANNSNFWSPFVGFDIVEVELEENPETDAAWTVADLQSDPEFGILVEAGSANIVFTSAELIVEGNVDTTGGQIDTVELYVCGRTLGGASAGENAQTFLGRIMATARSFYRLESQAANEDLDLVDILGVVAAPTAGPYNWDTTQFFDRLYFENSINATYYYSGASIGILTAPLPLGHTIWTFGNRLMKGDIISGGARSIKRVAWSALAAPDDWTGVGSGTLDLTHGGEGRLRKGLPLAAHVAALYLDKGIYNLRWTGDDAAPFVPKMQDSDTGIVAPRSCQATLDADGISSHIFLGRGPKGLDVFLYDGTAAHPIGGEIIDELTRLANHETIEYAFAALEPEFNLYLLFVAEGTDVFPKMCWVYDITSGQWVRWDLPFAVTAAGHWTLVNIPSPFSPDSTPGEGIRTLILGTALGIPYQLDYDVSADRLNAAGSSRDVLGYLDTAHESETRLAPVDYVIETGAVILEHPEGPKDIVQLSAVHRLWITYEDLGQCDIQVEISHDGGESYNDAVSHTIGTDGPSQTPSGELRETVVSFPKPKEARHHSIRISSAAGELEARQQIKISRLVIEYEMTGELP